jgi:hypothetical protein
MEHTPGPWEAGKAYAQDKNSWYAVVFSPAKNGRYHSPRAAEALGIDKAEAEANARLIAAAPDLLEVAQRWADINEGRCDCDLYDTKKGELCPECATRAAIAKATEQG